MKEIPVEAPPRSSDRVVRLIATNDLLGTAIPMRSTYGTTGSIAQIAGLVESQRRDGPTLWVDSGDLLGGVPASLGSDRRVHAYEGVGIAVACIGNHELDRGVAALRADAARLPFPLVCADRRVGVPPSQLVQTSLGAVGFVGVSHPDTERLSIAPPRCAEWASAVRQAATGLREAGARHVVALCHLGVTWFEALKGVRHEPAALESELAPVADAFDLILGGHTFTGWIGELGGVPAGQAHGFAGSVLVADLPVDGTPVAQSLVRPPELVAELAVAGADGGSAALVRELESMDANVIGELAETHTMPATNGRSLQDFVADAYLREVSDADAAFVASCELWTQAPLDGVVAALVAGRVSELDLRRLFPHDAPLRLAALGSDEFERLVSAHNCTTARTNRRSDGVWWNWARFPAGAGRRRPDPRRVCVSSFGLRLMEELLGRRVSALPLGATGSECVRTAVSG